MNDVGSAKKKCRTGIVEPEEESEEEEEEEEMVCSSSESPVSSEEEDNEITIQPQHPRLATKVGFDWETSDSVTANHSGNDTSDESEVMDESTAVSQLCTHMCARMHAHTHRHMCAYTHMHTCIHVGRAYMQDARTCMHTHTHDIVLLSC